jgi:hypothetical protein
MEKNILITCYSWLVSFDEYFRTEHVRERENWKIMSQLTTKKKWRAQHYQFLQIMSATISISNRDLTEDTSTVEIR